MEPNDPRRFLVEVRCHPAGGPFERWELIALVDGEVLAAGPMPVDLDAVRTACWAYRRRHKPDNPL